MAGGDLKEKPCECLISLLLGFWRQSVQCPHALFMLTLFLLRFILGIFSVSFTHWNDPLLLNGKNILHPRDLGKNSLALGGCEHLA